MTVLVGPLAVAARAVVRSDHQQKRIVSREDSMNGFRESSSRAILILAPFLALALGGASLAQAPALPTQSISIAEAHAVIEGAYAYAREKNLRLGVVVMDAAGEMVAGEHMDGAQGRNIQFAEGKAFAAVMYRTTSEALSDLYKTRPDRYFGIMNMYGSKIYMVGGGVPLVVDGKLVGAVGVAGSNQDEPAAKAGIAAWEKVRPSLRR
jgi:glc operon protein GlcG